MNKDKLIKITFNLNNIEENGEKGISWVRFSELTTVRFVQFSSPRRRVMGIQDVKSKSLWLITIKENKAWV